MIRAIYPGTFDPVHNGHLDIINRAARLFDQLVIGVFDHAAAGKQIKQVAFSVEKRIAFIENNCKHLSNIHVMPYNTLTVNFAHTAKAAVIVRGLRVFSDFEFEFRMAHANQRLAPEIDVVTLLASEEHTFLSGSTVREIAAFRGDVSTMVPANVEVALKNLYQS